MKKMLFVIIIALSACTAENKQNKISADTSSKNDTVKKVLAKEKSLEQQEDERLDKIMKKRKNVK